MTRSTMPFCLVSAAASVMLFDCLRRFEKRHNQRLCEPLAVLASDFDDPGGCNAWSSIHIQHADLR